jgi:isopenicillin-N N-acyltransferase-like protein
VRFERARTLLAEQPPASITETTLRTVLSDHEGAPDSICRHPAPGDAEASKTVFWCIADVTDGRITFGRGNPCDSVAQDYAFAPYAA